jgi:predicted ribosomally synthesized peptide with SipW-like signal peptide
MMRTILMSLLIITLIGGLAGGGTFAYFRDTERSNGNKFDSGTINLTVDGYDVLQVKHLVDLKPCWWFDWEYEILNNAGTLEGVLAIQLRSLTQNGGLNPEPERAAEDEGTPPWSNNADMARYLDVVITYCCDDNLLPVARGTLTGYPWSNTAAQTWQEMVSRLHDVYGDPLADPKVAPPFEIYAGKLIDIIGGIDNWKVLDGIMFPDESSKLQIMIHLENGDPDALPPVSPNILMGDMATVTKELKLTAMCGGGAAAGKALNLPDFRIKGTFYHTPDTGATKPSYWTAVLSGIPDVYPPYNVANGTYDCWCIDDNHVMYSGTEYSIKLVSSLDPEVYNLDPDWSIRPNAFNCANWLVNHYPAPNGCPVGEGIDPTILPMGTVTRWVGTCDFQKAIWYFLDGTNWPTDPEALRMVQLAIQYGQTYVPQTGDMALVVCVRDPNQVQIVAIEVDP